MMWDLLQWLTPTGSDVKLYQLCSSLLNEGSDQWGDLQVEMHPTWAPHSLFYSLTHTLQGMGIGQKPGCVVPLPWASFKELSNVQH